MKKIPVFRIIILILLYYLIILKSIILQTNWKFPSLVLFNIAIFRIKNNILLFFDFDYDFDNINFFNIVYGILTVILSLPYRSVFGPVPFSIPFHIRSVPFSIQLHFRSISFYFRLFFSVPVPFTFRFRFVPVSILSVPFLSRPCFDFLSMPFLL